MPNLRRSRRDSIAAAQPHSPASNTWESRLALLGSAIDSLGVELREVAIAVDSQDVAVTALGCHLSAHHGGWTPVTFRLAGNGLVPLGAGLTAGALAPSNPNVAPEWEGRLQRVGSAIEAQDQTVHALSLIQVDGGVVANASVRDVGGGSLLTWEFSDRESARSTGAEQLGAGL
jgi:hypothetical protein